MRHQKAGRKLGRTKSHRRALYRNMLASMFAHEKIETTTSKAKELRPLAEKLITLGKRGDLHARRQVLSLIPDRNVVHKLFEEIAPRYENRQGGYTRIVRSGFRSGDNAPLSIIELVSEDVQSKKKKGRKQKGEPKVKAKVKQEKSTAAKPAPETGGAPAESELAAETPIQESAREQTGEAVSETKDEKQVAEESAVEIPAEAPGPEKAETAPEENAEQAPPDEGETSEKKD